jgi:hypothetical protein
LDQTFGGSIMQDRPKSLKEIASRAEDLGHFGYEFAD